MLSLGGIVLSVFSLLVVSSVMNGFDQDITNRIIGTKAEIKLFNPNHKPLHDYTSLLQKLDHDPLVKGASPVVENELMLLNGKNMQGSVIYAIDLDRHRKVTQIFNPIPDKTQQKKEAVLRGVVNGMADKQLLEQDGIILGMDLAIQLQVSVGDTIQVVSPIKTIPTPLGMIPQSRNMLVIATFVSGMPEYDRLFSYISLPNGQFFSKDPEAIDYVQIKANSDKDLQQTAQKLKQEYPAFMVEDWSHFDPNLFSAMKMEKIVMISVLSLMLLITAFNMTGNLLKLTVLKRREIGILKAIGVTNLSIRNIFLLQGLIHTLLGILIGGIAAYVLLSLQMHLQFFKIPMGTFPLVALPVQIKTLDFIIVPLISLLISFISVLYPSRKIEHLNPIETIRN